MFSKIVHKASRMARGELKCSPLCPPPRTQTLGFKLLFLERRQLFSQKGLTNSRQSILRHWAALWLAPAFTQPVSETNDGGIINLFGDRQSKLMTIEVGLIDLLLTANDSPL